jgi:hypothetical protein
MKMPPASRLLVYLLMVVVPAVVIYVVTQPARPLPYADAPYYSRAFVAEMAREPGGWRTDGQLAVPQDFGGRWFNVRGGRRLTLGQPAGPAATLWLIGGAAVYGGEVPDAYTLASQLQNLLNKNRRAVRVENIGTALATGMQETLRLKTLPVKRGDVVVFYDGADEALAGAARPTGEVVSGYGNQLREAARWTAAAGARFVQVLQPVVFEGPGVPAPTAAVLRAGYAQFKTALPQLAAMQKWEYYDLSGALADEHAAFADCCRVTEHGNAVVAQNLYQLLFAVEH